jgi:hypothetical protein
LKTIIITVAADGSSQVETQGFRGRDCLAASRFVESALGRRIGERLTPEFHQQANVQQSAQYHVGHG